MSLLGTVAQRPQSMFGPWLLCLVLPVDDVRESVNDCEEVLSSCLHRLHQYHGADSHYICSDDQILDLWTSAPSVLMLHSTTHMVSNSVTEGPTASLQLGSVHSTAVVESHGALKLASTAAVAEAETLHWIPAFLCLEAPGIRGAPAKASLPSPFTFSRDTVIRHRSDSAVCHAKSGDLHVNTCM